MMKKISIKMGLASVALLATVLLASCNMKQCRCYEYVGNRWTGPVTTDTYSGNRCETLNTNSYLCNEMDDPILNPDDIAVGKKRK